MHEKYNTIVLFAISKETGKKTYFSAIFTISNNTLPISQKSGFTYEVMYNSSLCVTWKHFFNILWYSINIKY